jgi:PAS domain S-box-containing protein
MSCTGIPLSLWNHQSLTGESSPVTPLHWNTELSVSEEAIAQAALAPGPHAVISADRDGVIREWNAVAEDIFGHAANDAVGQTLDLVIPVEERADHWCNYRRVMANGLLNYRPDHILDVEGLRRNGTRVKLDVALIAIRDAAGHLVGITAIMREVEQGYS